MLGAIIGDIVGSPYEFNNIKTKDFPLFSEKSQVTDDTIMTLAVCELLQKHRFELTQKNVCEALKRWGRAYLNAGYGTRFYNWLVSDIEDPYYSCGNGAAMRVSACGWYGRDEDEVKELTRLVTQATHNHPEGLLGAEVTAMCVYYAREGYPKEFIKEYVEQYYSLDFDYEELKRTYKHDKEICQCTVPQAIYCFLISTSFEDCLRTTISIGGDCDTTAAISCAIADAYYFQCNIPLDILDEIVERMPKPIYDENKKVVCNPEDVITKFVGYRDYLREAESLK